MSVPLGIRVEIDEGHNANTCESCETALRSAGAALTTAVTPLCGHCARPVVSGGYSSVDGWCHISCHDGRHPYRKHA